MLNLSPQDLDTLRHTLLEELKAEFSSGIEAWARTFITMAREHGDDLNLPIIAQKLLYAQRRYGMFSPTKENKRAYLRGRSGAKNLAIKKTDWDKCIGEETNES